MSYILHEEEQRVNTLDLLSPIYVALMVALDPLPIGHYVANYIFAGLFALMFFEFISGRRTIRITPIFTLFTLTIVGHLQPVLMGTAIDPVLASSGVSQASLLLFLLVFFSTIFISRKQVELALLGVTAGFMITYVIGHWLLQRSLAGRATALFDNPNAAGMCAIMTIFCIRILWDMEGKSQGKLRIAWLALVGVCATHLIIASESRKSLLVIILLLGWALFRRFSSSRNKVPFAMLIISLGIGVSSLAFMFQEVEVLNRFRNAYRTFSDPTITSSETDAGVLLRLEFYKTGIEIIRDNPVFGQGAGSYRALSGKLSNQISEERVSHSTFVDMYVEGGLIAFLAYLGIFGVILYQLWKQRRNHSSYWLLMLFTLFSLGLELGAWRYMDKQKWLVLILMYQVGKAGLLLAERESSVPTKS